MTSNRYLLLNIGYLFWLLSATILILAALHVATLYFQFHGSQLFNLDREAGLGTALSSAIGYTAGFCSLIVGLVAKKCGERFWWWIILGLGMLVYSVDEVTQIHEGLASAISDANPEIENRRVVIANFGLFMLPIFAVFIWGIAHTAVRSAFYLVGGGLIIFWLSAFGIEKLEFMNSIGKLPLMQEVPYSVSQHLLTGVQETLELCGIALVLLGILMHVRVQSWSVVLTVTPHPRYTNDRLVEDAPDQPKEREK